MSFGSCRSRALRCIVLSIAVGGLLGGCNREMRGTLRDLGFHVDEPTTESTPAQGNAPAPAAPAAAAMPTAAAPASSAPVTAMAPAAPATAAAATTAATTPLIAPAPANPPFPLGDLHSGWIAGSIGEIPQPYISLTPSGSPYGTVQIAYHGKTGGTRGTIDFTTALLKPTTLSVDSEHEKSSVFAINLPVGDYVIDTLRFVDSNDLHSRNCRVENKLAVPFTVIPGTVNYIGTLLASADWGQSRSGMSTPLCGYFIVRDQSARDAEMLRQRFGKMTGPTEVHLLTPNTPEAEKFFRSK
jgi:hypothetical protein